MKAKVKALFFVQAGPWRLMPQNITLHRVKALVNGKKWKKNRKYSKYRVGLSVVSLVNYLARLKPGKWPRDMTTVSKS